MNPGHRDVYSCIRCPFYMSIVHAGYPLSDPCICPSFGSALRTCLFGLLGKKENHIIFRERLTLATNTKINSKHCCVYCVCAESLFILRFCVLVHTNTCYYLYSVSLSLYHKARSIICEVHIIHPQRSCSMYSCLLHKRTHTDTQTTHTRGQNSKIFLYLYDVRSRKK